MGFTTMSPVQERVLLDLPSYTADCLVQAKTGTGKTCAFLLPILHSLLTSSLPNDRQVRALIITPTRELALQIKKECDQLTSQLPRPVECHTAFGGTARASALSKFMNGAPSIVVATPGRLKDYLSEANVAAKFEDIRTVVLDEADTMLESGFLADVRQILRLIRPKNSPPAWQGMCFSATVPEKVKDVINIILGKQYVSISTVSKTEAPTIDKVPQFHVMYPDHGMMFTVMLSILQQITTRDSKIIVFGITANLVALYAKIFTQLLAPVHVFELHSRLSQNVRTRTTEQFKAAANGVIFASDVIGRGMDFPNTDTVLQVGLPTSSNQYIHRVGRTGRAGKGGRAILMLTQSEAWFMYSVRHLPIKPYPDAESVMQLSPENSARLEQALSDVDPQVKQRAYSAFIGFFAGSGFMRQMKLDKAGLVATANDWAYRGLLCDELPNMEAKTIGKMGLKGVPGFNVGSSTANSSSKKPREVKRSADEPGPNESWKLQRGNVQSRGQSSSPSRGQAHGQNGQPRGHPNNQPNGQARGGSGGQSGGRGGRGQRPRRGGRGQGGGQTNGDMLKIYD